MSNSSDMSDRPDRAVRTFHLLVVGWRRPVQMLRTLDSLARHNPVQQWFRGYVLDGGNDPQVLAVLEGAGYRQALSILPEHRGIAAAFDAGLSALARMSAPEDLVLVLEDDWECVRPLPLDAIREIMARPGPWAVRLFGRWKDRERRLRVDGRRRGIPGSPQTQWQPEIIVAPDSAGRAGERFLVGQSYWCHPPTITTVALGYQFAQGAKREPESIERSCQAGLNVAWLADAPCFYHQPGPGRRDLGGKR